MYLCPQDLLDSMYPFFMCKERMLITFLFTSHSKIVASAFYIPVCTYVYIGSKHKKLYRQENPETLILPTPPLLVPSQVDTT